MPQETNWGRWGQADQLGTLNYITPEVRINAAGLVRSGKVLSLAIPLAADQPSGGRGVQHFMLSTGQVGDSRPHWVNDSLSVPTHGTTHWDALGHVYGEGKMYNGYPANSNLTVAGALKNGVHLAADKIVTRGVLLDVAGYRNVSKLADGYVVTEEDLLETARHQNVTFRQGDVVLIRTGWLGQFYGPEAKAFWTYDWNETTVWEQPGIGWEASQWLKEIRAAAVAVDNLSIEAVPADSGAGEKVGHPGFSWPIHYELIRNQGMMIGALFKLDELADACAEDGIYEFLFLASPFRLTYGTGSPVNPLAIK